MLDKNHIKEEDLKKINCVAHRFQVKKASGSGVI
jgi:hypothetical protein